MAFLIERNLKERAGINLSPVIVVKPGIAAGLDTAQFFFIADRAYYLYKASMVWEVKSAATATLTMKNASATGANPLVGTTLGTAFDLEGDAGTVFHTTLASHPLIASGTKLGFVVSADPTSLAGGILQLALVPKEDVLLHKGGV